MNGNRNMAGLTEKEIRDGLGRRPWGCLVAAACGVALACAAAGWLVYLACAAWPGVCGPLAGLGVWLLAAGGCLTAAALAAAARG